MKLNFKSLLENKIVLYVMFFLALTTVFGYFMANNCSAVLFFVLLALLTNYFSKNMIVILGCAIVGTHLLAVLNMFGPRREGFKEGADTSENNNPSDEADNTVKCSLYDGDMSGCYQYNECFWDNKNKKCGPSKSTTTSPDSKTTSAFTNMGANNKLNPSDITPNKDQLLAKDDTAKAKEKAYDLLESTIGKDNLQGISSDTKSLLKKQNELMDELKNVTPLLTQAMGMVNNLDLNNLTGMFDKLNDMLPNKETKTE